MGILRRFFQPAVAVVVLCAGLGGPLLADEGNDALLEALQQATPEEAQRLDQQLRAAWSRSGSASMDLLLRRGRDALEEDDPVTAVDHFTALTDHAPEFAEGWHALARAYFERDLYGPSLDALSQALALNPDHYPALFGLGVLFQEFGEYHRAEEAFQRVLSLHPHHDQAQQALEGLKRLGLAQTL